jgi:PHD/YefM family antitoxin component YafN of YafNO toxin-antitoxin module
VDEKGQRVGVVLSPEEYEKLIEAAEQLDDIRHLEEAKKVKGKPVPWEKVKAELRAEGKLP